MAYEDSWEAEAARRAGAQSKIEGRGPIMRFFMEFYGDSKKGARRKAGTAIALGAFFFALSKLGI